MNASKDLGSAIINTVNQIIKQLTPDHDHAETSKYKKILIFRSTRKKGNEKGVKR